MKNRKRIRKQVKKDKKQKDVIIPEIYLVDVRERIYWQTIAKQHEIIEKITGIKWQT